MLLPSILFVDFAQANEYLEIEEYVAEDLVTPNQIKIDSDYYLSTHKYSKDDIEYIEFIICKQGLIKSRCNYAFLDRHKRFCFFQTDHIFNVFNSQSLFLIEKIIDSYLNYSNNQTILKQLIGFSLVFNISVLPEYFLYRWLISRTEWFGGIARNSYRMPISRKVFIPVFVILLVVFWTLPIFVSVDFAKGYRDDHRAHFLDYSQLTQRFLDSYSLSIDNYSVADIITIWSKLIDSQIVNDDQYFKLFNQVSTGINSTLSNLAMFLNHLNQISKSGLPKTKIKSFCYFVNYNNFECFDL